MDLDTTTEIPVYVISCDYCMKKCETCKLCECDVHEIIKVKYIPGSTQIKVLQPHCYTYFTRGIYKKKGLYISCGITRKQCLLNNYNITVRCEESSNIISLIDLQNNISNDYFMIKYI